MCGRYSITTPAEAMQRVFRFTGPQPNLAPRSTIKHRASPIYGWAMEQFELRN